MCRRRRLPELVAYAKANPDKLQIATDGPRRFSGLIAAWINKLAGTKISYVPYVADDARHPGRDLRARSALIILAVPAARGHIAAASSSALAVTSAKRLPDFPNVPTVAETFPGFDSPAGGCWQHRLACPRRSSQRVNSEMSIDPRGSGHGREDGATSASSARRRHDAAGARLRAAQRAAWGTLVKEIGLQPE